MTKNNDLDDTVKNILDDLSKDATNALFDFEESLQNFLEKIKKGGFKSQSPQDKTPTPKKI